MALKPVNPYTHVPDQGAECHHCVYSHLEEEIARLAKHPVIDADYINTQIEFSERTFGPGPRTKGISDHIRRELIEIADDPADVEEWIDIIILGIDGAWRTGASAETILAGVQAKLEKNMSREWPDWRTADGDKAIEHVRTKRELAGHAFEPMRRHGTICAVCGEVRGDVLHIPKRVGW